MTERDRQLENYYHELEEDAENQERESQREGREYWEQENDREKEIWRRIKKLTERENSDNPLSDDEKNELEELRKYNPEHAENVRELTA